MTIITDVRRSPGALEALRASLGALQRAAQVPFEGVADVHYGRWALLGPGRGSDAGDEPAAQLVFGADFAAPGWWRASPGGFVDRLVDAQVRRGDRILDALYRHCVGYPEAGLDTPRAVKRYLRAHQVDYAARYVAFPYRAGATVAGVQALVQLRRDVDAFLDARRAELQRETLRPSGLEPARLCAALREEALRRHPGAFQCSTRRELTLARWAAAGATFVYEGVHPLLRLVGRLRQRRAAAAGAGPGVSALATGPGRSALAAGGWAWELEPDETVQNPLTHVATLQGGRSRALALGLLLRLLDVRLGRYLMGLHHITTIHVARWVVFRGAHGRHRLLFFSNYDGSWDAYINSFLDNEDVGRFLSLIWSQTEAFPGAADPEAFKGWLKAGQVPTEVWHSAYRDLGRVSVVDLNQALQLRRLLGRVTAEASLRRFMATGLCPDESSVMALLSEARLFLRELWQRRHARAAAGRARHALA